MPAPSKRLACALMLLLLALTGCPAEEEVATGPRPTKATSTPGPNITGGSEDPATPSATASAVPTAEPTTEIPTPPPTAVPKVAVQSVVLAPTYAKLYPPPTAPAAGMGFSTQQQFSAYALRADDLQGGVKWVDRSGGQLSVTKGGVVTVNPQAVPGFYTIRAESLDDPSMFMDALVEVGSEGGMDVTID